jgi:hypothetical protein
MKVNRMNGHTVLMLLNMEGLAGPHIIEWDASYLGPTGKMQPCRVKRDTAQFSSETLYDLVFLIGKSHPFGCLGNVEGYHRLFG